MSAQRIGAKKLRKIQAAVGEPRVLRGWSHGGYVLAFVTEDHRHGTYDLKSGVVGWVDVPVHYSSCAELFPGG